jgi:hypothetical protein
MMPVVACERESENRHTQPVDGKALFQTFHMDGRRGGK